jgi:predicted acetyltransferase
VIRTREGKDTTLVEYWADERGAASGLESLPLTMYFGGARVRVGGIASVFTEEAYRKRGYARKCMEHAIELQRAEGALLSFLFGIPCYYEPLGYTVVMPWYGIYVALKAWKQIPAEPALVEAEPQHLDAMRSLYAAAVGDRVGPLVRESARNVEQQKLTNWKASCATKVLTDASGKVRGYVCHSAPGADAFEVVEVSAEDDAGREALLAYLLNEAARRGKDQLAVFLPPDEPFSLFLKRHDATFVVKTRPSGGGMARVLDWHGFCAAVEPVLQRRIGSVKRDSVPARLALRTEIGEVEIALGGSGAPVEIEAFANSMTQLLFGYQGLAEAEEWGARHTLDREVAKLMFPAMYPFMHLRDHF